MGDNCNPDKCTRCDKYNQRIAEFKQHITESPHIKEGHKQTMLARFIMLAQAEQRAIVRGYALFLTLKKPDTATAARHKIREMPDYMAFQQFYKAAM